MSRLKEEHASELEAKRKTETRLRNLEVKIASDKEGLEKMSMKLEKEKDENKKVSGREGRKEIDDILNACCCC